MAFEFYPLLAFIAIVLFYVAGFLIAKVTDALLHSNISESTPFIKLFIGVYTIVPIYAVIHNHLNTSLLGILIGMLVFLYLNAQFSPKNLGQSNKLILNSSTFIFVLFAVAWEAFFFFFKVDNNYRLPHYDLTYYGYLGQYIGVDQTENIKGYLNLMQEVPYSPFVLYHYFEFWTNNIFVQLGLNSATSHILITQPIFYCLILLGFCDLLNTKKFGWVLLIVFATSGFLLLNTNGKAIISFLDINSNIIRSPFSSFSRKIAPVLPMIIASLIYLKNKQYFSSMILAGMAICINVVYLPFILGGWGILLLIKRFSLKEFFTKGFLLCLPFGVLSAIFLYHLSSNNSIKTSGVSNESVFDFITGIKYIIGHFRQVIIYAPILIILFLCRDKIFKNTSDTIIVVLFGFICSIGLGFVMNGNHNSAQLSQVAGMSGIAILLAILLSNVLEYQDKKYHYLIAILGIVALLNNVWINLNSYRSNTNYTTSFIETFNSQVGHHQPLGFYLKDEAKFDGPYGKQLNVDFLGYPLLYQRDTFYTICLNPIFKDISEIKSYELDYINTSPLHIRKQAYPDQSDSLLIESVLKDYQITWGIVDAEKSLPEWILKRNYQEIQDANTGDKLIILE